METEEKRDIKNPTTYEEQIEILKSRNLIIENEDRAVSILQRVNYYRLSAYTLTYKNNNGIYEKVSIENVYNLYKFDKNLRNLILPMLEDIEIAFRTHISYLIAHKYGALGYKNSKNFRNSKYHESMLKTLNDEIERSDEIFVTHHKNKYNGVFPVWVIIEVATFGDLSKMYSNLLDVDKDEIAKKYYNAKCEYVSSWLYALSNLRNKCAHFSRLYNKKLTITPRLFRADKKRGIKNNTIFADIYVIGRLTKEKKEWGNFVTKLSALIDQYDVVDLKYLGFPDDWDDILSSIYNK